MSVTPVEPAETGFRVRGWHVFAGVASFFAVVIGVDAAFTVLALRTHPGEVSVTPYEDGLLYNRKLAQVAAQERLGWRAAAAAQADGVTLALTDRGGRPLSGLAVSGQLQRPATDAGRIPLAFREIAPGRYAARPGPLAGVYDLTVRADDADGRRFEAERRLSWP